MWMSCVQVPADEVCGCPLVRDVFEPTGEYCRVSKRKCNKHYCWEKLRRAEVDLERVRVVSALPQPVTFANVSFIWSKEMFLLKWIKMLLLSRHFLTADVIFTLFFINLTFNLSFIYSFSLLFPQWYKLDELFEQERNVRLAMTNRAGLMALMLHQTIQHDPITPDLRTSKDR